MADDNLIDLAIEQRCIAKAHAGDLSALGPVLVTHAKLLYATVVMPRVGNAVLAHDVVRETLATAVEKIDRFAWQGQSIYPWLRQIAINKIFDLHRHHQRSRRLADALAMSSDMQSGPDHSPDAGLIAEQERIHNRQRIDTALSQLTERYRRAIELRLISDLPRETCAEQLGISVGTFDVLLFRAVRAFRKHFGTRQSDDEQQGAPL
jgi:RNA polymerase sigma factor (sigma-70 family)